MIANIQKLAVTCISIIIAGIVFAGMQLIIGDASALTGVNIVDPEHGNATIKGEDFSYYYYGSENYV